MSLFKTKTTAEIESLTELLGVSEASLNEAIAQSTDLKLQLEDLNTTNNQLIESKIQLEEKLVQLELDLEDSRKESSDKQELVEEKEVEVKIAAQEATTALESIGVEEALPEVDAPKTLLEQFMDLEGPEKTAFYKANKAELTKLTR